MELCKRCQGTGHDGNCDVCGGSGFVNRTSEVTTHGSVRYGSYLWVRGFSDEFCANLVTQPKRKKGAKNKAHAHGFPPFQSNLSAGPAQHQQIASKKKLERPQAASATSATSAIRGIPSSHLCYPDSMKGMVQSVIVPQVSVMQAKYGAIKSITWHS